MSDVHSANDLQGVVYDAVVPARTPWSRVIKAGEVLRLIDLEGQQAVDFLCYSAADPGDRYNSMNTVKVQGNTYVSKGTVLYSDSGLPLFTVIEDSLGQHDTVYGCCSNPNNRLRYGVETTESCYSNFLCELATHGMDRSAIVSNVNFFMQVPIMPDGGAGVAADVSPPGSHVDLRAETDVLAVLSNCPQMHNPCNAYNPTPIRVIVRAA
jgi:urea carboxylase-associated protein 1